MSEGQRSGLGHCLLEMGVGEASPPRKEPLRRVR